MAFSSEQIRTVQTLYGSRDTNAGSGSLPTNTSVTAYEVVIDDDSTGISGEGFIPGVTLYENEVVTSVRYHVTDVPEGGSSPSVTISIVPQDDSNDATGTGDVILSNNELSVPGSIGEPLVDDLSGSRLQVEGTFELSVSGNPSSIGRTVLFIETVRIDAGNGTTADAPIHIFITPGGGVVAVESVNGKVGVVVLTASDLGLGNVDNTADLAKPISNAMQTALDQKPDEAPSDGTPYVRQDGGWVAGATGSGTVTSVNSVNPDGGGNVTLSKTDIGLGNVDNTSDASKPVSTATQSALDDKVDVVAGKQLSTEDYTTAEKTKLAGLTQGGGTPFTVADHALIFDQVVEKLLTSNQTSFDLEAYALVEEPAVILSNQNLPATTGSLQTLEVGSELPPAVGRTIPVEVISPGTNIILPMTSDIDQGQTASASHGITTGFPIWQAFDGIPTQPWFSGSPLSAANPQTLTIDLGSAKTVNSYRIAKRLDNPADFITRWIMEGSDDGVSWTTIDDQSAADVDYSAGDPDWFESPTFPDVTYRYYQLTISAAAGQGWPTVGEWELFFAGTVIEQQPYNEFTPTATLDLVKVEASTLGVYGPVLLLQGATYYTVESGVPVPVVFDEAADITDLGFTSNVAFDGSSIPNFKVISLEDNCTVTNYIEGNTSEPSSIFDLTGSDIASVDISAPAGTTVSAATAVGTFNRWNGTAWETATTPYHGNTVSELEALVQEDWDLLGASSIGFTYFNTSSSVDAAATDVTISTGDPGSPSAWVLAPSSTCEIRWYEDKVTFKAKEAGNFKLAFQDNS